MPLKTFAPKTLRLLLAGLLLLTVIGWLGLSEVEQQIKSSLRSQLEVTLTANKAVLEKWFDDRQGDIATFASIPDLRRLALALAEKSEGENVSKEFLLGAEEALNLKKLLFPIVERYGYHGYVIFNRNGLQIAALLEDRVNSRSLMEQSDFVKRALDGQTVISLPFIDAHALPTEKGDWRSGWSTMFAASPIYDDAGNVRAVLALRIRPEVEFSSVMASSRMGLTGETYAFNAEGLMISDSRFNRQLQEMGMIPKDGHAIMRVYLREPDVQASKPTEPAIPIEKRPFTRMAASALEGESGVDVEGYKDYRGIPVIGAWTWLKKHEIGLVTEIDAGEAFVSLSTLQQLFLKILGFLFLFMLLALSLQVRHTRTRNSLVTSEERNRSVVSSAMDAIITIHDDGIIESFNLAAERVFGYSESEVLGKNVSILMPEPYSGEHDGYIERYLRTNEPRILGTPREVIGLRKNKECFPLELSTSEMKISGERKFIGIVRDITERVKMGQVIRKKTVGVELLKDVAVAANEANNVEEAIQSSLERICRIIEWPIGHAYLHQWEEVTHPKLMNTSNENMNVLLPSALWYFADPEKYRTFKTLTESWHFISGAGLPGRVFAKGQPEWISDVTRDPGFLRAYNRDDMGIRSGFAFPVFMGKTVVAVLEFYTPEVIQRDDELLEVMLHIGTQLGRVVERRRSVDEIKLRAEELERANAELRDFTFIASHDLQEPMRKIVTLGDRLSDTNLQRLDEQGKQYLSRMQRSALYAQGFIYDLLAYSKVTSENERLLKLPLEKVLAEVIAEVQEEVDKTGAKITVNPLPVIEATELQVRHLFQNLITNALKYRKNDVAPVITIEAEKIDLLKMEGEAEELPAELKANVDGILASSANADKAHTPLMFWRITVADNGIGFDEKYSERIFKPFKRLHGRDQFPGSGMGLAICQKIVARLGGGIAAKGVPDIGAKFMVYLPAK